MDKLFGRKRIVFGLVVAAALGLVTWGFAALRAKIGDGCVLFAGTQESVKSFGGIGLEIARMGGSITVVQTLDGKPADKAGVESGDRIVKVNDEPVGEDPDIRDVVSKLRGKPGTEVTVTVKRGDATKTFTITREKIEAPETRLRFIEPKRPRIEQRKPEEFRPFGKDWPWAWRRDQAALEEYRKALRKLEEAGRKLRDSFPQPPPFREWDFPDIRYFTPFRKWDFPERRLFELHVPKWPGKPEEFRMEMDVEETDDAITIRCDMPGMKKEDIDITLKGNVLTIKGERSVEEETRDEKGRVVRRERRFGSFSRSFTIPGKVKTENIKTSYEDGVLTIFIPKEEPKPEKEKEIKIKIGVI